VVETPYGAVRADSPAKAEEIAGLLEELAPRVQAVLPGSQARPVEIWVQDVLRVYRFNTRPVSVRGFTLLSDEFHAKRIHLQEEGQSPWYLSHELVHALVDSSWRPLPGILEEGLGDVVAEILNPTYASHIRAHRLLNASGFTGGLELTIAYSRPEENRPSRSWDRLTETTRIQVTESLPPETVVRLLGASRSDLHRGWNEIPESFYGIAWLVTARIVERIGLVGLHELCLRATAEGYALIPIEWLLEAAELDLERLDPSFLASCFGPSEMRAAAYLQAESIAEIAIRLLKPYRNGFRSRSSMFSYVRPSFLLPDGSEVRLRSVGSLMDEIYRRWSRVDVLPEGSASR